jgi:hypothetical protein
VLAILFPNAIGEPLMTVVALGEPNAILRPNPVEGGCVRDIL